MTTTKNAAARANQIQRQAQDAERRRRNAARALAARAPQHTCYKMPTFDCPACQADEAAQEQSDPNVVTEN